jgi:hypothetical protein
MAHHSWVAQRLPSAAQTMVVHRGDSLDQIGVAATCKVVGMFQPSCRIRSNCASKSNGVQALELACKPNVVYYEVV